MRNETSEADASDLACGAERSNAADQPPEWADLKPAMRARDDVNRVIENIAEVHALDDALSPKSSAVTRIRWSLLKQAALMDDLPRLALRLIPLVLDSINRDGKLGWRNNSHFARLLDADPAPISRAFAALEHCDFIVRTGGHRRRLVWSVEQRRIVCGGRGPSYTFGKAGFATFQQLIDADEVAASATSHAERNCCDGNFIGAGVAKTATSNSAKLPIRAGQEESSKPSSRKPSSFELGARRGRSIKGKASTHRRQEPSKPPILREATASPPSARELFSLDEQGAVLVRKGSAFKWLDPKTGESRQLSFQFIASLAPHEPRDLVLDFAESELIAAVDSGLSGALHGIVRKAIDKGRLASFKRRRMMPTALVPDDREPEAPAPITAGSWD